MSYALKLAAAAIAFLLAGVAAIVIFSGIWARIGFGAAIVIVCGSLLFSAWRTDKKAKESRAGLERI